MSGRLLTPLFDVLCEMEAAERKHGANYMGSLTRDVPEDREILEDLVATGREAKLDLEESGDLCRTNVFAEEVGELAEDLLAGKDITAELVQVAAMALAWLDVDATEAKEIIRRHSCPGRLIPEEVEGT